MDEDAETEKLNVRVQAPDDQSISQSDEDSEESEE